MITLTHQSFHPQEKIVVMATINPIRNLQQEMLGDANLPEDQTRKVTQLKDLLERCHMLDPIKRATIDTCLMHPFIREKMWAPQSAVSRDAEQGCFHLFIAITEHEDHPAGDSWGVIQVRCSSRICSLFFYTNQAATRGHPLTCVTRRTITSMSWTHCTHRYRVTTLPVLKCSVCVWMHQVLLPRPAWHSLAYTWMQSLPLKCMMLMLDNRQSL